MGREEKGNREEIGSEEMRVGELEGEVKGEERRWENNREGTREEDERKREEG